MAENDTTVRLEIQDVDDLSVAQEVAEASETDIQETSGPPGSGSETLVGPITAVLIGAGVLATAKFLTDWWERRRGGLVINCTSGSPVISRDGALDYGYVVLMPADGSKVTVEVTDAPEDAAERLIALVIDNVLATVKSAVTVAGALVDADKVAAEPA